MGRKTIGLSTYLDKTRNELEEAGVFDSTLGIDTKLFIDPKLLVNSTIPEFTDASSKIVSYFSTLLRRHRLSARSPRLRDAVLAMLAVPEPRGLSIGYGNKSDRGTAIPINLARAILFSASELLSVGIDDPGIIEVLPLFVDNFGPDRLSDLISSIIHENFCNYSSRVSKELDLETRSFSFSHGSYDLPTHPFLKDTPIIFVPIEFLRPLPVATDWDEITAAAEHNEGVRDQFNQIIYSVLKEQIGEISTASDSKKNEFRKEFEALLHVYREIEVDSYNLQSDVKGYYGIQPFVDAQIPRIPKTKTPKSRQQLLNAIRALINQFSRAIVDNGGNKLLYKKTETGALTKKPHHEDVAQIIFYLIADQFCSLANIALARESDAGRGPVDFWLGNSYESKILVEIKKSTNNSLVDGFTKQVSAYEKSENAFHSFYVVLVVKDRKVNREGFYTDQLEQVQRLYEDRVKNKLTSPELVIVDGIVHPSPSNL